MALPRRALAHALVSPETTHTQPRQAHRQPRQALHQPNRVRRILQLIASLALVLGLLSTTIQPATAAEKLSDQANDAVGSILTALQTRSNSSDPRYLQSNLWVDGSPQCFRCTLGPAVLSAAYGVHQGLLDTTDINNAIATLDRGIKDHQQPNGSYGPPAPGESGPDIQTILFANELAETYMILGLRLDFNHRTAWQASLAKSADWLIRNGNLTYYTNGNLNLALTINMDLTYRVTNLTRFKDAAARSLAFTLSPPQTRWKGYGLKYTVTPTKADGSDGRAYLAESGGKTPGYDPAYTIVQANLAAFWYYLTNDATAKRLTNLLYNQNVPRVRKSDWSIDVSGGTRRVKAGVRYRYLTPALPILAYKGGRTDLKPDVAGQFSFMMKDYGSATTFANSSYSFGYGSEVAAAYLAIMSAPLL